jgi:hypothetical protein
MQGARVPDGLHLGRQLVDNARRPHFIKIAVTRASLLNSAGRGDESLMFGL